MMFQFAHIAPITLPLEDPILKFLLILIIILAAPLLLNKLKIPYLLGLIIAGAVIGPHGLNLVLRDSSIILSGTAGLLYIMFLSGLDMDTSDFKKSGWRSLVFGLYTFCVPLALGILAGYYIMGFPIYSSILLAGLFASQTLIAYPIVSKLGISRDKAVTIAAAARSSPTRWPCCAHGDRRHGHRNVDESFWWRLSARCCCASASSCSSFRCWALVLQTVQRQRIPVYLRAGDGLPRRLPRTARGAGTDHRRLPLGLALNRLIPRTLAADEPHRVRGQRHLHPLFLIAWACSSTTGLLPRLGEHRSGADHDRPDHGRQIHRRLSHAETFRLSRTSAP